MLVCVLFADFAYHSHQHTVFVHTVADDDYCSVYLTTSGFYKTSTKLPLFKIN